MEIRITLPSAVEGEWKLEEPNTLVIKPYFYRRSRVQHLIGISRLGDSGRRRDSILTINPVDGCLRVCEDMVVVEKIAAPFDDPAEVAKPSKKKASAS